MSKFRAIWNHEAGQAGQIAKLLLDNGIMKLARPVKLQNYFWITKK
jgi:hypothetical protein